MIIVGLLGGKTKEEWYAEIAKRVANGDGPCAPPEYAEFRGPGVHHNFDDSDSGYDMDMDQRSRGGQGKKSGRIILLGDGSEVLTGSEDTEMFDQSEEDEDLASQVPKGDSSESASKETAPAKSDAVPEKLENSIKPDYRSIADKELPPSAATAESAEETSKESKSE